jgi:hypothetical protein
MGAAPATVDHGVCGAATVRLVEPPERVATSLVATLGASVRPSAQADVVVRFVDRLPSQGLRRLELAEAAFDDEAFYVVDAFGARTRLDLDRIGTGPLELVCERSVREIPLLIPILGLVLLAKGHVLLHAAAFVHRGRAFLAVGWKKGGKTELLLAYMSNGAAYIADEWTLVSPDGTAAGLGGPVRVWGWHLQQLPELRKRVPARMRARLALADAYRRGYGLLPRPGPASGSLRERFDRLGRDGGVPWFGQVALEPTDLFGRPSAADGVKLDVAILMQAGEGGTTTARTSGREIARRMVASQEYERAALLRAYDEFRFAFPGRRNDLLEHAAQEEQRLLEQALENVPALELRHPYPVQLGDLYAATEEWLSEHQ